MSRGNGKAINIGPEINGIIFRSDLDNAIGSIAKAVSEDVVKIGKQLKVHHEVLQSFEGAHNAVSDITETNSVMLRFLMEKLGYIDKEGTALAEYSEWIAAKHKEVAAMDAAPSSEAAPPGV